MKLFFIRHGKAEGKFSHIEGEDYERLLTAEGVKSLRSTFEDFIRIENKIDVIFTSPLLRATQTAEIMWEYYQNSDLELMSDLDILDDPKHLVEYISFLPKDGHYAFVGHDPHITNVISGLLMLNPEQNFLKLKKGGICALQGGMWDGFELDYLLTPKVIKKLSSP